MSRFYKAIFGSIPAVVAVLNVLAEVLGDGTVSPEEWGAVIVTVLAAFGVYRVPNTPPPGEPEDPEMSERATPAVRKKAARKKLAARIRETP